MTDMDGFYKSIVVRGHNVEVYNIEGEGLTAFCEDYPSLEVTCNTLADLKYEVEIAMAVEEELDSIWYDGDKPT
jgi:hypothetical protein